MSRLVFHACLGLALGACAALADALGSDEHAGVFLDELDRRLDPADRDLTDRQRRALYDVLYEGAETLRALLARNRDAGPDDREAIFAGVRAVHARTDAAAEAVLTEAQVPTYRALQAEARARLAQEVDGRQRPIAPNISRPVPMTERYDETAAAHYAAYRPSLHREILGRVLPDGATFDVDLDVGSGTGRSAVALAERCRRVQGVEPSRAILEKAEPSERVTYLHGTADAIPLPDGAADVVTLAGVLVYVDSEATRAEIRRVGRPGGLVVVYDFEVLADGWLERLGVVPPAEAPEYDHGADLSGAAGFTERSVLRERAALPVAPEQLAHLLLSDSGHLDRLAGPLGADDPFRSVVGALRGRGRPLAVDVDLYATAYTST